MRNRSFVITLALLAPASASAEGTLRLDDAVRSALTEHPDLLAAQQRVEAARGQLSSVRGTFDEYLDASVDYQRTEEAITQEQRPFVGADSLTSDVFTARLGLSKTFRWGMRVNPSVAVTRSERDVGANAPETDALNRAQARLQVTQPILRNVGASSAVLQERTSEIAFEAAERDLEGTAQRLTRDVVNAYWTYAASVRRLALLEISEALAKKTAEDTRALIAADERPAADALQLEATEADRRRQRLQAESSVFADRRRLGLAMGLDDARAMALPPPARSLPTAPLLAAIAPTEPELAAAVERRPDVIAARLRLAANGLSVDAADWNTLPELDASFGVGYSGRLDRDAPSGLFGALTANVGPSVGGGLTLRLPVRNAQQRGALLNQLAARRQAELQLFDLERNVRANLAIAHNQLLRAAEAVTAAQRALELFEGALDAETEKLAAQLGTVLDVVLSQERLLNAQISSVDARAQNARAHVDLEYQRGVLPNGAEDQDALARLLAAFAEEATP
ncbi:MAG: TolC family protein [Deltaproteobacteria bacterium]|jgi:outer membrane protein TolC